MVWCGLVWFGLFCFVLFCFVLFYFNVFDFILFTYLLFSLFIWPLDEICCQVQFEPRSAELRISKDSKEYALSLRQLEGEIVPNESKHRVSAGKRHRKRTGGLCRVVKFQKTKDAEITG